MYKKFKLYLKNKNGGNLGQYGPVNLPDRKRAIEFANRVFKATMDRFPGSYIDVEEV